MHVLVRTLLNAQEVDFCPLEQIHIHIHVVIQVPVRIIVAVLVLYNLLLLYLLLVLIGLFPRKVPHILIKFLAADGVILLVKVLRNLEDLELLLVQTVGDDEALVEGKRVRLLRLSLLVLHINIFNAQLGQIYIASVVVEVRHEALVVFVRLNHFGHFVQVLFWGMMHSFSFFAVAVAAATTTYFFSHCLILIL